MTWRKKWKIYTLTYENSTDIDPINDHSPSTPSFTLRSSRAFDSAFRFLYPWTACHGHQVVVEGAWSNIYQTLTPSFWTSANQVGPVSSRTSLAIPPLPRFSWAHTLLLKPSRVWLSLRNSDRLVGSSRSCEWERIFLPRLRNKSY